MDFFKSFFERNSIKIPKEVLESFHKKFPKAYNVEWHKTDKLYEAIFYIDEIEIISKFFANGKWLETGTNRDASRIPEKIRAAAEVYGEIMNSIEFETESQKKFEIIVRDTQLNRYVINITDSGDMLSYHPIE